jgi:hypothetical protein
VGQKFDKLPLNFSKSASLILFLISSEHGGCRPLSTGKTKFGAFEFVSEICGVEDFWAHANNFLIYEPILLVFLNIADISIAHIKKVLAARGAIYQKNGIKLS